MSLFLGLTIALGITYGAKDSFASIDDDQLSLLFDMSPLETKLNILRVRPYLIEHAAINIDGFVAMFDPTVDLGDMAYHAGKYDLELPYLKTLSTILGLKIKQFSEQKVEALATDADLIRHAYALLFTSKAYLWAAWCATLESTVDIAGSRLINGVANDAVSAAHDSAMIAATKVLINATDSTAKYLGLLPAESAAFEVADTFVETASYLASKSNIRKGMTSESTQEVGRIVHRTTEKVSLLYLLKSFDQFIEKTYSASINNVADIPEQNIFVSTEVWSQFKSIYFDGLNYELMFFLDPWLNELDRITEKVERIRQVTEIE